MKTSDEIKKAFEAHNIAKKCASCPYKTKHEAHGLCIDRLCEDAEVIIQQLEQETTWHPFPAEKPSDGALVWVYSPSALLYWSRYNYAEYRHDTFWRGAERVDNVTAWMTVKEAGK